MSLNSRTTSKRLRTDETNFEDEKTSSSADDGIVGSVSAESNVETTTENAPNTVANVFTDDILPVIFDNVEILSVEDLFNFRLVNRCWRNAATSALLKRNLGKIAVQFVKVAFPEGRNAGTGAVIARMIVKQTNFDAIPRPYKSFIPYQPRRSLSDLSALISTSPKFPCNSICFHSDCPSGFEKLCLKPNCNDEDHNSNDLRLFFSLYGKKIKNLSLSGKFSKQAIQSLLYVHMPHLTCLDLQDFGGFQDQPQEMGQKQVCLPQPSTLEINEIVLRKCPDVGKNEMEFVNELMSVSPNLSSIQNADMNSLLFLHEMGKSNLVKDLQFYPMSYDNHQLPILTDSIFERNLSGPKLCKLSIRLFGGCDSCSVRLGIMFLKTVLSLSTNSLKCLELLLNPVDIPVDFCIPPLPSLTCLRLVAGYGSSVGTRIRFVKEVLWWKQVAGDQLVHNTDTPLLNNQENSIIPANYFPRLREVNLEMGNYKNDSDKLMGFFSMEHLGLDTDGVVIIPGDTLPTVTYLEVSKFLPNYRNMSKLFPNVSHLKINRLSWSWSSLPNWIWTAFPKLKRFEVSLHELEGKSNMVDSFFTGISPELYATFESAGASTELMSGLKRTRSYIGDCENLKEFKLNFKRSLCSKFASKVTAVCGFKDVIHRTKIIFSFESVIEMSAGEIEETHRNLDDVAAFVEIRMNK